MNETYLTLQGWIPLRFDDGSVTGVGLFLYNHSTRTIINRQGILRNEIISADDLQKFPQLSIVSFSDIPDNLKEQAINLALG